MPAGLGALGFVYFAGAKYVGYSAFCRWAIEPQLLDSETAEASIPNALKAGAMRTVIGVAIGVTVGIGYWYTPWASHHDAASIAFFSLLVPIRVFEWWLLLRWAYKDFKLSSRRRTAVIAAGVLASFALDALGVGAAFVLPGGAWIC